MALPRGSRACSKRSRRAGLFSAGCLLSTKSAQAGAQHRCGRYGRGAEGEHDHHDGDEHDDNQQQSSSIAYT